MPLYSVDQMQSSIRIQKSLQGMLFKENRDIIHELEFQRQLPEIKTGTIDLLVKSLSIYVLSSLLRKRGSLKQSQIVGNSRSRWLMLMCLKWIGLMERSKILRTLYLSLKLRLQKLPLMNSQNRKVLYLKGNSEMDPKKN